MILSNTWEHLWVWMRIKSTQVPTAVWCHLVVLVSINLNINIDLVLWLIGVYRIVSAIPWFFQLIAYISRSKQERFGWENCRLTSPPICSWGLACLLFSCPHSPSTPLVPSTEFKNLSFSRLRTGTWLRTLGYHQSFYFKKFIIVK